MTDYIDIYEDDQLTLDDLSKIIYAAEKPIIEKVLDILNNSSSLEEAKEIIKSKFKFEFDDIN